MVGDPPAARIMLAQSLTVTKLVMHCTRGAALRTARSRAANSAGCIGPSPLTVELIQHPVQSAGVPEKEKDGAAHPAAHGSGGNIEGDVVEGRVRGETVE